MDRYLILTKNNCKNCLSVKKYMNTKGLAYDEVNVDDLMTGAFPIPERGSPIYDLVLNMLLNNNELPVVLLDAQAINMTWVYSGNCSDGACKL